MAADILVIPTKNAVRSAERCTMSVALRCLFAFFSLLALPTSVVAKQATLPNKADQSPSPFERVHWQNGPGTADLGGLATIGLPADYIYAGAADTRMLMEANGNPPSGEEVGFFAPMTLEWFAVFEFSAAGYIRDDESATLDPDAILSQVRAATDEANVTRKQKGFGALSIIGWTASPHYDAQTHNLEWAIEARQDDGGRIINHNTRLLGRDGVMKVTVVADSSKMLATLPVFRADLRTFGFKAGHRYAEYRQGDKLAQYGLTALIVGGAAAVAVKSGFAKYIGKLIMVVAVGIGASLRRIFRRKQQV